MKLLALLLISTVGIAFAAEKAEDLFQCAEVCGSTFAAVGLDARNYPESKAMREEGLRKLYSCINSCKRKTAQKVMASTYKDMSQWYIYKGRHCHFQQTKDFNAATHEVLRFYNKAFKVKKFLNKYKIQ